MIKKDKPVIRLKETGDYIFFSGDDKPLKKKQTKKTVGKTLNTDWDISFEENRGVPPHVHFDKLISYTKHDNKGIKYFSGTATYTKTVTADKTWFGNNTQLWLELGDVKNIAEVYVNGKALGIIWKKPFRVNITSALKPGANTVVVKVTNLWVNRLIGDAQPNVTNKITYTTMPFYQPNSKLQPSGLLGPVQIMAVDRK